MFWLDFTFLQNHNMFSLLLDSMLLSQLHNESLFLFTRTEMYVKCSSIALINVSRIDYVQV